LSWAAPAGPGESHLDYSLITDFNQFHIAIIGLQEWPYLGQGLLNSFTHFTLSLLVYLEFVDS
jgi:hypothetical protein